MVSYIDENPVTKARLQADAEARRRQQADQARAAEDRRRYEFASNRAQDAAIRSGLGQYYAGQHSENSPLAPAQPATRQASTGGTPSLGSYAATPGINPNGRGRENGPTSSVIRNLAQVPGGGKIGLALHTAQDERKSSEDDRFLAGLERAYQSNNPHMVQALFQARGRPVPAWAQEAATGMAFINGMKFAQAQGVTDPNQAARVAFGYVKTMATLGPMPTIQPQPGAQGMRQQAQAPQALPTDRFQPLIDALPAPAKKPLGNPYQTAQGYARDYQMPDGSVTTELVAIDGQPMQPYQKPLDEAALMKIALQLATTQDTLGNKAVDQQAFQSYYAALSRQAVGGQDMPGGGQPGPMTQPVGEIMDVTLMKPDVRRVYADGLPVGGALTINGITYRKVAPDQWQEVLSVHESKASDPLAGKDTSDEKRAAKERYGPVQDIEPASTDAVGDISTSISDPYALPSATGKETPQQARARALAEQRLMEIKEFRSRSDEELIAMIRQDLQRGMTLPDVLTKWAQLLPQRGGELIKRARSEGR